MGVNEVASLLAQAEGVDDNKVKAEIIDSTKTAQRIARENNIAVEVKWFRFVPRNTLLIINPNPQTLEGMWIQVEEFQPRAPADLRPILRLQGTHFRQLCSALLSSYMLTWNTAASPPQHL